jgi:transcriptional regulator with GAF, ATPase, and Fis domain
VSESGRIPSTVAGLVAELSELPSLLLSTDALDKVVWEAAMIAVRAIDEVDACGVTVLREGSPVSIMPGTAPYGDLEQRQYEQDDGPVVQAMRTGKVVVVSSMSTERSWDGYPAFAAERGVGASICLPLVVGEQVLGAITLYAKGDCDFTASRRIAELVSDLASTALSCMSAHAEKAQLTDQLRQALESRAVIEQAKGVLMARHGCDADRAFNLLRRSSQHRNIKLRDIAAIVMDTAALG